MVHVAGYKSRGYRRVTIYLRPDICMALLLRSINERRDMLAIVNEALGSYLNGAPSRSVAQASHRELTRVCGPLMINPPLMVRTGSPQTHGLGLSGPGMDPKSSH